MTIPPTAPASAGPADTLRRRLLLVDDDLRIAHALRRQLEGCGFEVSAFTVPEEAILAAASQQFDGAVLEYSLPGTTGIELMHYLRTIDSTLAVVILSGTVDVAQAVSAIRGGAEDVQTKPHNISLLQAALERGLERTHLQRSRRMMKSQFIDPYGVLDSSPIMQRVVRRVQHSAGLELPILLTGEAGTGKRAIAEMIHELSPQAKDHFIAVAMRDRSASEIDTSIDAFFAGRMSTGESARRTLFLDDVDTIDGHTQRQLTRVLDADYPFRLIVATRIDLAEEVRAGRLHADLYRRLAMLPIAIPALRERGPEAIMSLGTRMLQRLRIENGEGPDSFTRSALDWPGNLHWPANIPQLRDVITEAFTRAIGEITLDTHHLTPSLVTRGIHAGIADQHGDQWTLSATERRQIVSVLGMSGNNRSQAARLLGITRTTLYKKLREYGHDSTP